MVSNEVTLPVEGASVVVYAASLTEDTASIPLVSELALTKTDLTQQCYPTSVRVLYKQADASPFEYQEVTDSGSSATVDLMDDSIPSIVSPTLLTIFLSFSPLVDFCRV